MEFVKSLIVIFATLIIEKHCYCPPLSAPETTRLICEEPTRRQILNCSTSWLPQGTIAYFKCQKDEKHVKSGRIVCFDDGTFLHVHRSGNSSSLPCKIEKALEKPEIHVYGYKTPVHYQLTTTNSSEDFRAFGEKLHNDIRSKHGAPPLKLLANLSSEAQNWADHVATTRRLDMAPEQRFGQNIFLANTNDMVGAVNDAVQNWYHQGSSEYRWEDVSENWHNSLALDFTQLIWKDSKFLGIGAARVKGIKNNSIAVIAFYDPPGNIVVDDDTDTSEKFFKVNVQPQVK